MNLQELFDKLPEGTEIKKYKDWYTIRQEKGFSPYGRFPIEEALCLLIINNK